MLASALIPNAARGIKSPKVTSNAVMIGVVRIWTRSNRGASVGMVELCLGEEDEVGRVVRDEVEVYVGKGRSCLFSGLELEREPVMRRMEGDARDGMANVPCLSERRPCSLKKKDVHSPLAMLSLTRRFPSTSARSSTTAAPHLSAHASRLSSSERLSGRLRYGMWTWASDGIP